MEGGLEGYEFYEQRLGRNKIERVLRSSEPEAKGDLSSVALAKGEARASNGSGAIK